MLICFQKEMEIRIMDDGSRLPWIIAIILLFCAMYFAVTETAMASAEGRAVPAR